MTVLVEKYAPIALAILVATLLLYFRAFMVASDAQSELDLRSLYSAVLDWSSIQTGFLFGIFGFVAGKNDGFIAAARNTEEMRLFFRYIRTAITLGFLVTFVSIPLMVGGLSLKCNSSWNYTIFIGWSLISTWSFFSFARVAYAFGILVRVKDQTHIPG